MGYLTMSNPALNQRVINSTEVHQETIIKHQHVKGTFFMHFLAQAVLFLI